jgi:hypothetical protein
MEVGTSQKKNAVRRKKSLHIRLVLCSPANRDVLLKRLSLIWSAVVTIDSLSALLGQTSGVSSPHQKKFISISVHGKRGTVQPRLDLSPLDFDMWGSFKPWIQLQLEMNGHFTSAFWMSIKPFLIALGRLRWCDRSWSDVAVRVLIQVEDILSICCVL